MSKHASPDFISPAVRSWLYGIVTAALPLLALYGVVSDTAAPLWLGLAAALLSTSTAFTYRPTKPNPGEPR